MFSTNCIYFCPRSPKYNLVFPPDSHMIHRCRPGGPIIWVRHVIDPWQWSPHQLPYVTACNGWLPRDQPTRSCALILLHAENSRAGSSEVTFHKGWWFVRKCFVIFEPFPVSSSKHQGKLSPKENFPNPRDAVQVGGTPHRCSSVTCHSPQQQQETPADNTPSFVTLAEVAPCCVVLGPGWIT